MSLEEVTSLCETVGVCHGCDQLIYDHFFLMVSQDQWHLHCLKCVDCNATLDNELTCFIKNGLVFCRADYYKRYATTRCSSCCKLIDSTEMVMRARDCVFHLECFMCEHCKRVLNTGESFGMNGSKIYCHVHYDALEKQVKGTRRRGGGRPRKRKNAHSCNGELGYQQCLGFDLNTRTQKAKRVRTSFKHHQLLVMKTYFAINHNPDSKSLKQLSMKTGLSKRVLQVWFQNARAKYRRIVTQGESAGDSNDGEHYKD